MDGHALGCTVGVIHLPDGMLFFKNRDLAGQYIINRLTVFQATPEAYMLRGVNLQTGASQGASIGVNRYGVCVANTHIRSTDDVTYDVLCEALLCNAREKRDVPGTVRTFMEQNSVQGGRILVAGPGWTFLVEVLGSEFQIREIDANAAITNTFSLLPNAAAPDPDHEKSSANRLQVAQSLIRTVASVGALKSMLRSHIPEQGALSICNHRPDGGGTESSHIIEIRGRLVTWSSLAGPPCENDYHSIQLFAG